MEQRDGHLLMGDHMALNHSPDFSIMYGREQERVIDPRHDTYHILEACRVK
jgi:hypothetical protein